MALRCILLALVCLPACLAHIKLTWPPARYPQLDFLDNARSATPCGVTFSNKKPVVTTVAAGGNLDLQWHLGFAHRGGVEVNLFTPIATYNLTAGFVYTANPTLLTLRVTLPTGITCQASNASDCFLQMRHQALEWGANYIFHSCADLSIAASASMQEAMCSAKNGRICSGNGQCMNGQCMCQRLASGAFCQNVDECMANTDCGGNAQGVCVDTGATSYPKKQCYCRAGWMGPRCVKESTLTNAMIPETGYYDNKMKLSDNYYLYWKVMNGTTAEIEIAVKVRTASWVGLGWRPAALTSTCSTNPGPVVLLPGASSRRRCRVAAEPEAEASPEPTVARAEPTGEPETAPEPSSVLPFCDANGNPPTSEPEAEVTAEPETTASTATPAATVEPEGSAEPEGGLLSHAMDCRDMVIGMAKGCSFRLTDSYSRDRSTPQPDSFFGGVDDLKGAVGMEHQGWTYLKFMRKMNTESPFDHPITLNGPMNMVWAHGQRQGAYTFNALPSGVQVPTASDPQFYKDDELKYHGFTLNRNTIAVDFSTKSVPAPTGTPAALISHSIPAGCEGSQCTYKVTGNLDATKRRINVQIQFNNANNWVALGTNSKKAMAGTDLTMAYIANAQAVVTDRYATQYALPAVDTDQSQLQAASIQHRSANGVHTISFTRDCLAVNAQDKSFSNNYLVYGYGPLAGGVPGKHQLPPVVSTDRLTAACAAAAPEPEATSEPEATGEPVATTRPEPEVTTARPEGNPEGNAEPTAATQPPATQGPVVEQIITSDPCINLGESSAGQLVASAVLIAVCLVLAL